MDRGKGRKLALAVFIILLAVSVFTLVARALGWYTGAFHFPFLFLFIPFVFPLFGRGTDRPEDSYQHEWDARYCPECGAPTEDGAEFCRYCGRKL